MSQYYIKGKVIIEEQEYTVIWSGLSDHGWVTEEDGVVSDKLKAIFSSYQAALGVSKLVKDIGGNDIRNIEIVPHIPIVYSSRSGSKQPKLFYL